MMNGLEEQLEALPDQRINKLNIGDFVQNATWKELLIELVDKKRLDPWDLNIEQMVEGYIEAIRRMKVLDLRVPANVILAASILLRMKSESFNIFLLQENIEQDGPDGPLPVLVRPEVDVSGLTARARLQPHRKITLQELIGALDAAIKAEEKRKVYVSEMQIPLSISVSEDIDKRIADLYAKIRADADRLGMTTLDSMRPVFNGPESFVQDLFIPLLFLAHKGSISLIQEEFFNDIVIKLTGARLG